MRMRVRLAPKRATRASANRQDGEGEQDVHEPCDDRVEHAAVVTGDEPEGEPEDEGDRGRPHPHLERDAGAVDEPRQDVAAEVVCPEKKRASKARPGGRRSRGPYSEYWVLGGWPIRLVRSGAKMATRQMNTTNPRETMADLVAAQPPPGELHRGAALDA